MYNKKVTLNDTKEEIMRKNNNIFSNSNKNNRRRKLNVKRAFLLMVVCLVIFGSFNKVKAYVDETIKEKQQQKIEEQKRLAEEEKKRKEEEEAKKRMIGVREQSVDDRGNRPEQQHGVDGRVAQPEEDDRRRHPGDGGQHLHGRDQRAQALAQQRQVGELRHIPAQELIQQDVLGG